MTGISRAEALAILGEAGGEVKTAIVMKTRGMGAESARKVLATASGDLRATIEQ